MTKQISLTEANKIYEELIERTCQGETFSITRYGKDTALLLPYEEYIKLLEESPRSVKIREAG